MARATHQKARKDYPAHGIKKGEMYYKWSFRFGGTYYSKTRPRPSQLTQSEFLSQLYSFQEEFEDFSDRDENLVDFMREKASDIRGLGEEQEGKRDNMPEGLQDSETGELLTQRAEGCERIADELETQADELESAINGIPVNWEELDELDEADDVREYEGVEYAEASWEADRAQLIEVKAEDAYATIDWDVE